MTEIIPELLIFLGSLMGSMFYSTAEAAIISISPERSKQLINEGGSKGRTVDFLFKNFTGLLTTILIGNTLVNSVAAAVATQISEKMFKGQSIAISVLLTTIVIVFFGEIIPKTLGRNNAEKYVHFFIKILQLNYYLFYPLVLATTALIHKILGKKAVLSGRLVTKDDIEFMVNRAEKEKSMDAKQLDLLSSILEFPTIKVKDIMIQRTKIVSIPHDMPFEDILKIFNDHNHSRYPVCEGDLDQTIGFLHVKDLIFISANDGKNFNIRQYLKSPFFVYEHMKIQAVFDHMNRKKVHLALVKDENGLVVGIITLEDIVEEILGEIHDEHDSTDPSSHLGHEHDEYTLSEGIVVEADTSLRDLYNNYDIKIPLNDNYSSLSGFLLDMMGNNFPKQGMMLFWEGYSFKLEKVDNYEIIKVRISDVEGEKHLYSKKISEKKSYSPPDSSTYKDKKEKKDK